MTLRRSLVAAVSLAVACPWMWAAPADALPAPDATWSSIASPPTTVAQTRAVFLKNKVYVPGGWLAGFADALGTMQIYATSSDSWSVDNQAMPSGPMAQPAVCTDGSKIYVVGGITKAGALLSTLQIYDPRLPKGARWSSGPNMHTTATGDLYLREAGCAWIAGRLYVFGGDAQSDTGSVSGITSRTWEYNPHQGTWSETPFHMIGRNWNFGYTSDGTNAFIAGGEDAGGHYYRNVEMFAPTEGWASLTKLPVPKGAPAGTGIEGPGMGLLGSSLALFGGTAAGGPNALQVTTLTCQLPCGAGQSWKNAHKNLAHGRSDFAWAGGGSTPTLYAVDGIGSAGFVDSAEKTT